MRSCFPQKWPGISGDSGRPFGGSSEAGAHKNQSSYSGSYLSRNVLLSYCNVLTFTAANAEFHARPPSPLRM
jgi:hypothetical protein